MAKPLNTLAALVVALASTGLPRVAGADAAAVEPVASASQPAPAIGAATQKSLVIAIAKWRGEDFAAAGTDLARLINGASPDQRELMSAQTRATIGLTLAELAADAHYRAAVAARRGSAIRLPYVTEYEKPTLVARLSAAYVEVVHDRKSGQSIAVSRPAPAPAAKRPSATTKAWYAPYPVQSQPASQPAESEAQFAVIDWIGRPESFQGSTEQAKTLAERVHRALSLLNERVRIDPAMRRTSEAKRALLDERARLIRLARVLDDWSDRQALTKADEQKAAREQARREQFQQQIQAQRTEEEKRLQEARANALKWEQEAQKTSSSKSRGLFGWLLPQEEKVPASQPQP
jgi:hypothetical protein